MRVLVVSAWPPGRMADGSSLILHHHLGLLAARHEIDVLAADGPGEVPAGVGVTGYPPRLARPADFAVRRVAAALRGEPPHTGYVGRHALRAELRRRTAGTGPRPDLVHLFGWGTAGLWPDVHGLPTVHTAVDPWARNVANRRLSTARRLAHAGENGAAARHERRHYPRLGAVVLAAPHDAAWLRREVPGGRYVVVANGVVAGPEPVAVPPGPPVVGFHGTFDSTANAQAAAVLVRDVLPLLRAAVPDVRVHLVGRDPGPEVRALAGDGVLVTGAVPDVRPELDRMHVYLAPLLSGTGLRNKVLEAMAAGRPVVATPLAVAGIGAGQGVRVASGALALADNAIALLFDPAQAQREGRAGRARVCADFTWERSAQALEALWDQVRAGG